MNNSDPVLLQSLVFFVLSWTVKVMSSFSCINKIITELIISDDEEESDKNLDEEEDPEPLTKVTLFQNF